MSTSCKNIRNAKNYCPFQHCNISLIIYYISFGGNYLAVKAALQFFCKCETTRRHTKCISESSGLDRLQHHSAPHGISPCTYCHVCNQIFCVGTSQMWQRFDPSSGQQWQHCLTPFSTRGVSMTITTQPFSQTICRQRKTPWPHCDCLITA